MWKAGMIFLGVILLGNAVYMLIVRPPVTEFNYWPLVTIDLFGFLFSLGAFFKIAVRKSPPAEPPIARRPESAASLTKEEHGGED